MAESKEPQGGYSPQNPEWKHDFSPGPSEEEFSRFKGPEWRSELPDIRMQGTEKDWFESQQEYFFRQQAERGAAETSYTPIYRALDLKKEKGAKIEKLERLSREQYLRASFFRCSEVENLLDEVFRYEEVTFQADRTRGYLGFDSSILQGEHATLLSTPEKEKAAVLKFINAELEWFTSAADLTEAAGIVAARYYDAWLMTNVLITASGRRRVLLTDDFSVLFTRKDEGLNLTKEEVEDLPKGIGLDGERKEGIRERMVDYLSEQHFWKMAVWSLNNYNPLEAPERVMPMRLTETQIKFVRDVFKFGDGKITVAGKDFPAKLLFYHTSVDSGEDMHRWYEIMMALLLTKAYDKLLNLPDNPANFSKNDDSLYGEILGEVSERVEGSKTREGLKANRKGLYSNDEKLARLAVKLGVGFDYVTHSAAEFGQYLIWEEKKDKEGKVIGMYPELGVGGPDTATDIVNALLWVYHELEYSVKARVRTPLLPPFDTEWKDFTREYGGGLGWIPNIVRDRLQSFIVANPSMRRGSALLGLWGLDRERDLQDYLREVRGDKRFNPEYRDFLEEIMFGIPTPYKNRDGRPLVMPIPLRTGFTSVNFLRNLKEDPKRPGKTVQDILNEGKLRLKDIDFSKFFFAAFDEFHVNLSMGTRVLPLMYGVFDEKVAADYFPPEPGREYPSTGHLIKRYDLFTRREHVDFQGKKVPRQFFEVIYTAYEVAAYLALKKHGVWDAGGYKGLKVDAFWDDINRWIYAAESLPKKKGEFENYRDSVVLTMRFLAECFLAIHEIASRSEKEVVDRVRETSNKQQLSR